MLHWRPGVAVNMETDLIGKYVRNLLRPWAAAASGDTAAPKATGLNMDFLLRQGFL